MSTLGDRIKRIRDSILKQNQADFAKKLGFSRVATISDYEKNKRSPDITSLRKIASVGGVTLEWLLTGNGPVFVYDAKDTMAEAKEGRQVSYSEEFVEAKVYDMSSATWPGGFSDAEPVDAILIPKSDFKAGPLAVRVKGDSMSPAILNGATVGIDRTRRGIVSGGLYAVWLNYEGVTIKRVFIYPDRIVLKPDNPAFPEAFFPTKYAGEEFIIGRVVWLYQRY